MIGHPKVIGIILAYQHATFLEELYRGLPRGSLDEVIVSNDDSGDGIEVIAGRLGIPCYSHPRMGYGGNLKFGMHKAIDKGADYIVEIHGDNQFDTAFIGPAVDKMNQGFDLVLGSRFVDRQQPLRDKMPLVKYLANIGLSAIARTILGVPITEFHTGARIYSRQVIEAVHLDRTSDDFIFGFEILAQAAYHGFKFGEVPTRCYYGRKHTSISLWRSTIYALQMSGVLSEYGLARLGFRTKLFDNRRYHVGNVGD